MSTTTAPQEPAADPAGARERFPTYDIEGLLNSKLHQEYLVRMAHGRDLRLYITARSETGVGKTTLAYVLANLWDIWGWGASKATLRPQRYAAQYDDVPPGSVMILDEAERALDARRSNSSENVAVGHTFAAKRYRQVVGILTLPTKTWLDKRIRDDMADYWIQALETDKGKPKGEARVYRLKSSEHYETNYTKRYETISWPKMDDVVEYQRLDAKKRDTLQQGNSTGSDYYTEKDLQKARKEAKKEGRLELRDEIVERAIEVLDTQKEISKLFDVDPSTITRWKNEN